MGFQKRSWTFERIGWVVMVLLVVAALLGLFSTGPLSQVTVQDPEGLVQVQYDRFQRYRAPTTLRVTFLKPSGMESPGADAPGDGATASLRISRTLVDAIGIERIQPEPEQVRSAGEALVFVFRRAAGDEADTVLFAVKPDSFGPVRGEIGLVGHEPIPLAPFIYP